MEDIQKKGMNVFLIISNRGFSSEMLGKIIELSKSETYYDKLSISIVHITSFTRKVRWGVGTWKF